jgi:cytochrome c oxidase subunit II
MLTKGKSLIAFVFVTGLAAYGTLAQTRPDLKPVQGGFRMATIADGSAVAHADTGPQVVGIVAGKFHFTPDHITLKKGQPVILRLTSSDATHGFMLRALKIDTDIKPGKVKEIRVTPTSAGTFKAICDHYCGLGHGNMKMTVVVE